MRASLSKFAYMIFTTLLYQVPHFSGSFWNSREGRASLSDKDKSRLLTAGMREENFTSVNSIIKEDSLLTYKDT